MARPLHAAWTAEIPFAVPAGNERMLNNSKERVEEGKQINKSLFFLSEVAQPVDGVRFQPLA